MTGRLLGLGPSGGIVLVAANFGDVFVSSLVAALNSFLSFVPAIIGAIVILIVGWIIARAMRRVFEATLMKIGFDAAVARSGLLSLLSRGGVGEIRASHVVGLLVLWFVRLIFIEAAANAVHLTEISVLLNSVILFIPNLLVALLVVLIGALLAGFLAVLVRAWAGKAGIGDPDLLGKATQFVVVALSILVALDQVGIAAVIVDSIFIAFVGGLALAFALAFGLGGRDTANGIMREWSSRREARNPSASSRRPGPSKPPPGQTSTDPPTENRFQEPVS